MTTAAPQPSLGEIARTFLRLGTIGFGGPLAHLALLRQELVERRRWIAEQEFVDVFGVTGLLPGPNSTEVAIHTGYLLRGRVGGLVSGTCFAAPAVLLMAAFAAVYVRLGDLDISAELFTWLRAAVIGILAVSVWRLRRAIRGRLGAACAAGSLALSLLVPRLEPVWLLAAGAVGLGVWAIRSWRPPRSSDGGFLVLELGWVMLRTGLLLFGGGLVLVPLLQPEFLSRNWLTRQQLLDAVALGQATPGPIVTAATFIGWVVAGPAGAAIATVGIFAPAFVSVLFGSGPGLRRLATAEWLRPTIDAVNAAALGAVGAATISLTRTAVDSPATAVVAVAAAAALVRGVPIVAVVGIALGLGLADAAT